MYNNMDTRCATVMIVRTFVVFGNRYSPTVLQVYVGPFWIVYLGIHDTPGPIIDVRPSKCGLLLIRPVFARVSILVRLSRK